METKPQGLVCETNVNMEGVYCWVEKKRGTVDIVWQCSSVLMDQILNMKINGVDSKAVDGAEVAILKVYTLNIN